ncbi:MAG: ybaW [Clostridia bacterium]|jgi:acyl-CoA thioester hydrolase|uniref:acyl-CoA thioesterase n=1 Tax=Petroclostridium xylanilyticum TaxID=1792311 RepID=UPI000B97E020|nr:thioesterase family protein [Petroclostridium xylanilyticum]MBZ4646523.1 ybaW [Clostridia bacterium]
MKHEFFFEVRGYELDSFGHVNNAVYLNYLEEARWKFFDEMKWMDFLKSEMLFPVVVETNIRYIRELKMFDKAVVKTHWKYEDQYLITDQDIYFVNTNKKVAKATGKMILVSFERIVHELPDFIKNELDKEG